MHFGEPGLIHNGARWAISGRVKSGVAIGFAVKLMKIKVFENWHSICVMASKHSGNAVQTTIFVANDGHEQIRAKALRGPGQRRRGALSAFFMPEKNGQTREG